MLVVGCSGGNGDVHAAQLVDLVVVNFRENNLFGDTHCKIAAPVKLLGANATEVADSGNGNIDQTIKEFEHALVAQCDFATNRPAVTDLETRNRLARLGDDGFLASNLLHIRDRVLEHAVSDMEKIAGQKPVVTKSRKSIAGFKIRDGWPIGCKVTLRDERMFEFLDRLINIAIPRIRDFRGISPKQFDGRGNFAMGVTEQIIFPEIDYDQIDKLRGMDITISTTAANDEQGRALLAAFNFPFRS